MSAPKRFLYDVPTQIHLRLQVVELTKWLVRLAGGEAGTEGTFDFPGFRFGVGPHGTTAKDNSLPPETPPDGCPIGDVEDLLIDSSLPV